MRIIGVGAPAVACIDHILTFPCFINEHGLRANLITELSLYYVLAENVAYDIDVLQWWYTVKNQLPNWYNYIIPQACIFQPTSCAAERVFSMLKWMFGKKEESALEDYKEYALISRYNTLARLQLLHVPDDEV
jgi:hypothetical protein